MRSNYCNECGSRLTRKSWRAWLGGGLCDNCAGRRGSPWRRSLVIAALIAIAAFALGRHLRPSPPPLIIQRLANSPLSDFPVNSNETKSVANKKQVDSSKTVAAALDPSDDVVYICGARTKKGTPCHRRVHFAGERCFQHKGMPAMVPLEKLIIRPINISK